MAKKATTSRPASAADAGSHKPRRRSGAGAQVPAQPAASSAPATSTDAGANGATDDAQPGRLDATASAIGRTLGRTAAVIADHLPGSRASDGLDLLERDHRRLETLLQQGLETDAASLSERKAMLERLTRELVVHEQLEEKVLYPILKSHAEARDIVLEGYQEHHVADLLLNELQELPPSDERWGAKLKVLQESLEHHIEEEEGEMFKTARSVLSREQLEEIGTRMAAMRQDLQSD